MRKRAVLSNHFEVMNFSKLQLAPVADTEQTRYERPPPRLGLNSFIYQFVGIPRPPSLQAGFCCVMSLGEFRKILIGGSIQVNVIDLHKRCRYLIYVARESSAFRG